MKRNKRDNVFIFRVMYSFKKVDWFVVGMVGFVNTKLN